MNRLIVLMVAVSMLLFVSTSSALQITNIDGDGFEDLSSGCAYSHYHNSGILMDVYPDNNGGDFYNSGSLGLQVFNWLVEEGYTIATLPFVLEDTTDDVTFTAWNGVTDKECNPETPIASSSGQWYVNNPGDTISFYAVKASNAYAFYLVNPAYGYGAWSTYDLWATGNYGGNDPLEISHFTAYNSTSTPVPEPATMLLLGTGLVGISIKTRKHIKK